MPPLSASRVFNVFWPSYYSIAACKTLSLTSNPPYTGAVHLDLFVTTTSGASGMHTSFSAACRTTLAASSVSGLLNATCIACMAFLGEVTHSVAVWAGPTNVSAIVAPTTRHIAD